MRSNVVQEMLMRLAILLLAAVTTGCVSHSRSFKSASEGVLITHDRGSKDRNPTYRIVADGRDLGQVRSIIDAETIENVSGLPRNQEVIWSQSGKTALIYEDMSDASPDYRHILIRISPDSRSFQARKIDFGTRHSSPEDIYGHWPSVKRITDQEIELEWASEPKIQKVQITEVLSKSEPISEGVGGILR